MLNSRVSIICGCTEWANAIIFGSDTMARVVQTRRFRDVVLLCYFAADVR
jgi:hypothetical protein